MSRSEEVSATEPVVGSTDSGREMTAEPARPERPFRIERSDWPDWPEWPEWLDLAPRRLLQWLGAPGEGRGPFARGRHGDDLMRVEELVEGDSLVVRAEMPGIDPDRDVQVHVRNHTLEIRAQRREEEKSEERGRFRSEFRYGAFTRVVPLPPDADEHDVRATYRDGILEVRMPLDQKQADVSRIEVERA